MFSCLLLLLLISNLAAVRPRGERSRDPTLLSPSKKIAPFLSVLKYDRIFKVCGRDVDIGLFISVYNEEKGISFTTRGVRSEEKSFLFGLLLDKFFLFSENQNYDVSLHWVPLFHDIFGMCQNLFPQVNLNTPDVGGKGISLASLFPTNEKHLNVDYRVKPFDLCVASGDFNVSLFLGRVMLLLTSFRNPLWGQGLRTFFRQAVDGEPMAHSFEASYHDNSLTVSILIEQGETVVRLHCVFMDISWGYLIFKMSTPLDEAGFRADMCIRLIFTLNMILFSKSPLLQGQHFDVSEVVETILPSESQNTKGVLVDTSSFVSRLRTDYSVLPSGERVVEMDVIHTLQRMLTTFELPGGLWRDFMEVLTWTASGERSWIGEAIYALLKGTTGCTSTHGYLGGITPSLFESVSSEGADNTEYASLPNPPSMSDDSSAPPLPSGETGGVSSVGLTGSYCGVREHVGWVLDFSLKPRKMLSISATRRLWGGGGWTTSLESVPNCANWKEGWDATRTLDRRSFPSKDFFGRITALPVDSTGGAEEEDREKETSSENFRFLMITGDDCPLNSWNALFDVRSARSSVLFCRSALSVSPSHLLRFQCGLTPLESELSPLSRGRCTSYLSFPVAHADFSSLRNWPSTRAPGVDWGNDQDIPSVDWKNSYWMDLPHDYERKPVAGKSDVCQPSLPLLPPPAAGVAAPLSEVLFGVCLAVILGVLTVAAGDRILKVERKDSLFCPRRKRKRRSLF